MCEDPHAKLPNYWPIVCKWDIFEGHYDLHELIRQWDQPLHSARQPRAIAESNAKIDNIRTAWGWTVAQRKVAEIAPYAAVTCLGYFYELRAGYQEGEASMGMGVAAELTSLHLETIQLQAQGKRFEVVVQELLGQAVADNLE